MPRLVRKAPLSERLKAYLDPYDFLLWLAELLNDDAYDEWLKDWSTPIGIALNILFILAQGASAGKHAPGRNDDVFGDAGGKGSGWFSLFAAFLVQVLTLLSCANAVHAFSRKRHYRLFEQPVDVPPATPSARRVKMDSSPAASPFRYLRKVYERSTSAEARAHPDAEREVWELSVWDPKPASLTVFTLFSPGHLLVYFSLLPPATLDPRPSVTVAKAVVFGALLSLQMIFLKTSFSQQAKDSALLHGEVMNEYDTKFVRPSLHHPVRDVGIQTRESAMSPRGVKTREVDVYMPTTIINRGFNVSPNPYVTQDPSTMKRSSYVPAATPLLNGDSSYLRRQSYSRPSTAVSTSTSMGPEDFSSPIKPHHERLRERSPMKGDGGSMGAYSHAASPLRKAASSSHLRAGRASGVDGREGRVGSPLKRMSMPGGGMG
jgi:hypothetical protein